MFRDFGYEERAICSATSTDEQLPTIGVNADDQLSAHLFRLPTSVGVTEMDHVIAEMSSMQALRISQSFVPLNRKLSCAVAYSSVLEAESLLVHGNVDNALRSGIHPRRLLTIRPSTRGLRYQLSLGSYPCYSCDGGSTVRAKKARN